MRLAALALLALACGEAPEQEAFDAAPGQPDARPGRPDARPCIEEGSWDGTYLLDWECVDGCESDAPYRYTDTLEISGTTATYRLTDCEDCTRLDTVATSASCFDGAGIPIDQAGDELSDPYTVCIDGCTATGDVSWTGYPGPLRKSTWRVTLTR